MPFVVDDENNACVEEENEDDPPSVVVDIEGNKGDESTKGDVPKCPPPYHQRLMKKKEDNQFKMFSKLLVNIPLVDALL